MNPEPENQGRKSTRLKDFDYSLAGGYFVTIVAQLRQNLFGEIQADKMTLNDPGIMIQSEWQALPNRFPNIDMDIFQVMPNHFHGILIIHDSPVGAGLIYPGKGVPAHPPNATQDSPVGAGLIYPGKGVPAHLTNVNRDSPVGASLIYPGKGVPAHPPNATQDSPVGAGLVPAHPTLGDVVGAFKSKTTHKYIQGVDRFAWPPFYKKLWQRNYYEHIIRDQEDYQRIAGYILDNPSNWAMDEENLKFSQ